MSTSNEKQTANLLPLGIFTAIASSLLDVGRVAACKERIALRCAHCIFRILTGVSFQFSLTVAPTPGGLQTGSSSPALSRRPLHNAAKDRFCAHRSKISKRESQKRRERFGSNDRVHVGTYGPQSRILDLVSLSISFLPQCPNGALLRLGQRSLALGMLPGYRGSTAPRLQ
jgi:hypothetical protein